MVPFGAPLTSGRKTIRTVLHVSASQRYGQIHQHILDGNRLSVGARTRSDRHMFQGDVQRRTMSRATSSEYLATGQLRPCASGDAGLHCPDKALESARWPKRFHGYRCLAGRLGFSAGPLKPSLVGGECINPLINGHFAATSRWRALYKVEPLRW